MGPPLQVHTHRTPTPSVVMIYGDASVLVLCGCVHVCDAMNLNQILIDREVGASSGAAHGGGGGGKGGCTCPQHVTDAA